MKQQDNAKLGKKMYRMIAKWNRSGLTLKDFSKTSGVSYSKLKYWKQKFDVSQLSAVQSFKNAPGEIPDFIPVELPHTVSGFTGIELSFPNNVKITCPSEIGIDALKTLIKLF